MRLPAPPAHTPKGSVEVVPGRGDMPELVVTALLAPSRLTLKLLRAFMWSLVFSAALVAAAVYGCIAFTHVLCRPRRGCCGRPRSTPPACLSDPTLGEHCFLTLKVSARAPRGREEGCVAVGAWWGWGGVEQPRRSGPVGLGRAGCADSKWLNPNLGLHVAGVFKPSEEGFPRSRTVPSPRARACACTMSPPDVAMGPSCCFCTASQRTGRSEAQGPGAHKAGGEAGGGARTTRASRRQARGLGRLGAQSIQMGC